MKKIITILFLLLTTMVSAQTSSTKNDAVDTLCMSKFTVVYNYSIRTFDHNGEEVTDSILLAVQVGNGIWKCTPYQRVINSYEPENKNRYDALVPEALMHIETIVSNYPESKLTIHGAIAPFYYEVIEDKENIKWELNDAIDTICNYECRGAICEFRGKKWNVMYTEEIPSTAGPWKLQGLPGLITIALDNEGIHSFTLVGLYNESLPILFEKHIDLSYALGGDKPFIKHFEKSTHKQMLALKKKVFGAKVYASNPKYSFPKLGASDIDITILSDDFDPVCNQINGITVLEKAHKYQPLELK